MRVRQIVNLAICAASQDISKSNLVRFPRYSARNLGASQRVLNVISPADASAIDQRRRARSNRS
eukprot:1822597-Pleurochrysis_carterae.AAC.1